MRRFIFLVLLCVSGLNMGLDPVLNLAHAATERYPFPNEEQKQRFDGLMQELRCMVCQNQNLADSNAPLAEDLRKEVYEQVLLNKPKEDITDYLVHRYGEFVRYSPTFQVKTALLWMGPVCLFVIGGVGLLCAVRRQKQSNIQGVSDDEQAKLNRLLATADGEQV